MGVSNIDIDSFYRLLPTLVYLWRPSPIQQYGRPNLYVGTQTFVQKLNYNMRVPLHDLYGYPTITKLPYHPILETLMPWYGKGARITHIYRRPCLM